MGEGQIATLQQKIAEISAQIAQLKQTRRESVDPSERAKLAAQIASLQETRQALEDALSNLQFPPEAAMAPESGGGTSCDPSGLAQIRGFV
jgi:predicted  nucleic acid-binding Zn-ribbon protein